MPLPVIHDGLLGRPTDNAMGVDHTKNNNGLVSQDLLVIHSCEVQHKAHGQKQQMMQLNAGACCVKLDLLQSMWNIAPATMRYKTSDANVLLREIETALSDPKLGGGRPDKEKYAKRTRFNNGTNPTNTRCVLQFAPRIAEAWAKNPTENVTNRE